MNVERLSKPNRSCSRATDKNDNHTKDPDRSQVQFSGRISMK